MAISYFRWIKTSSPDLTAALKNNQLRSTHIKDNKSVESRSALWVFRMDLGYKPGSGISADRTLVKITYNAEGERIMEDPENHLDFEEKEFAGEAGHPTKIIVKSNEKGARGIGAKILEFLNARVQSIVQASAAEIKKATS